MKTVGSKWDRGIDQAWEAKQREVWESRQGSLFVSLLWVSVATIGVVLTLFVFFWR